MAWLGTYAYRIELTVDSSKVDSTLSHFPLPLMMGSSSGIGSKDLTAIYTEVGSNYLKTAYTKSDGTTQLHAEIEKWESRNMIVWISNSDLELSSSSDTSFYIYFDSTQTDNTTYVGTAGSKGDVWDTSVLHRYNMAQSPVGVNPVLDSIPGGNDLATYGTMAAEDLVDGVVGDAINFNGVDQYFYNVEAVTQNIYGVELNFKYDYTVTASSPKPEIMTLAGSGGLSGRFVIATGDYQTAFTNETLTVALGTFVGPKGVYIRDNIPSGWHHLGVYWNSTLSQYQIMLDGVPKTTYVSSGGAGSLLTATQYIRIGNPTDVGSSDVTIDEVRIYGGAVGQDWLKASYYAQIDNLLTYGDMQYYDPVIPPPEVVYEYQARSPFFTYEDMFKALDENSNAVLLASHLPIGRAWQNSFRSDTNLGKLVAGLAVEYYRLGVLMGEIPIEMDIEQTNKLLVEWEKSCGIPGDFFTISGSTLERRRLNLKMIFTNFGGVQVAADFERVAEYYGFDVDVMPLYYHGSGFPYSWPLSFAQETNKFTKHTILVSIIDNPTTGAIQFPLVFPLPFYSDRGTTLLKTIFELLAPANVNIEFTVYSAQ